MDAPAPSIEEVVSTLTARLDGALEIREHAQRLLQVADAQEAAARDRAVAAFGEGEGETLFRTVSAIHVRKPGGRSRVSAMPELVAELRAPWDEVRPAAAGLIHGVAVDPGNRKAADRLVAEARKFALVGDDAALEARAAKLYGQHQWRGELLRAAYAAAAAELGPSRPRPRPKAAPAEVVAAPAAPTPARPVVLVPGEAPDPGQGWGDGPRAAPRGRPAAARLAAAPSLFPVGE